VLTLILAVKVIAWPNAVGFAEEDTTVVVLAGLTVCKNTADVLVLKLPSPA